MVKPMRSADAGLDELLAIQDRLGDTLAILEAQAPGLELAEQAARRALKGRKSYLWLSADGSGPNPAIDGKNAEIRTAQHAAICQADPEIRERAAALDEAERALKTSRAAISSARRALAITQEALHTRRRQLLAAAMAGTVPECYSPGPSRAVEA